MKATAKRGEKAKPASKPGAWDKPERQAHATKKGPARKSASSSNAKAPGTAAASKAIANIGRRTRIAAVPRSDRRFWREGEPVHVVKPVRAARLAKAQLAVSA